MFNGKAGEIYNIGSNCELSNIKMANLVFQNYNALLSIKNSPDNLTNDRIHFVKDRLSHDFRYANKPSKIKKDLNWNQSRVLPDLKKQFRGI